GSAAATGSSWLRAHPACWTRRDQLVLAVPARGPLLREAARHPGRQRRLLAWSGQTERRADPLGLAADAGDRSIGEPGRLAARLGHAQLRPASGAGLAQLRQRQLGLAAGQAQRTREPQIDAEHRVEVEPLERANA